MERMKNILKGILLGAALLASAWADVDMYMSNPATFQRNGQNSTYTVDVFVKPQATANIAYIEAYVSYNNTIFSGVTITDQLNSSSGAIWETNDADANYDTNGNYTMVKYIKANTTGTAWVIGAGQVGTEYRLYTLTFTIKNDASLGSVQIPFDLRWASSQDDLGHNITGTISNTTFTIATDTTAPITSVSIPGGYYNSDKNVALNTNETNDEVTINYSFDGSTWQEIASLGSIVITADAGTYQVVTLDYYATDWSLSGSNEETPHKQQVYYMDTIDPVISNVAYTSGALGIGSVARVTFDVTESSDELKNDPVVTIGGRAMSKVSGSHAGQYVYTLTLNGSENTTGIISITVTDKANNATNDSSNNVLIDLNGPTFEIGVDPDPTNFLTTATITVTANKEIKTGTVPDVVVSPENPAAWKATPISNTVFLYNYFVTGNGWTAVVPWLQSGSVGDEIAPIVLAINPTADAAAVIVGQALIINITDNITVASASIMVTINGNLAVNAGQSADDGTYQVSLADLNANGYQITIIHPPFQYWEPVTINVYGTDGNDNPVTYTYIFTNERDLTPPYTSENFPTKWINNAEASTNISFIISDKESGVNTASIALKIDAIDKVASASIVSTSDDAIVGAGLATDGSVANYVSVPDSSAWAFGDSNFTIEYFVKWTGTPGNSGIIGQSNGGGSVDKWDIFQQDANTITFHENSPTETTNISWTWTPLGDTWYHLAVVRKGSDWDLYVDGVKTGGTQVATVTIPDSTSDLRIGTDGEGSAGFNGSLDEVKIYNRPLTAAEVLQNYERGLAHLANTTTEGLIGYWSFDTDASDASGFGHDGTLEGSAAITGNAGWLVTYEPDPDLSYGTTYNININAENINQIAMSPGDIYDFRTIGSPQLRVIARTVTVNAPLDYTGDSGDFVPGARITYTIVVQNDGETAAMDCSIKDIVPASTHLYYGPSDEYKPTLNGQVDNINYVDPGNGAAPGSEIKFEFDNLAAFGGQVTINYSVTLD